MIGLHVEFGLMLLLARLFGKFQSAFTSYGNNRRKGSSLTATHTYPLFLAKRHPKYLRSAPVTKTTNF